MSTKATIILTDDNEHIYHEVMSDTVVIEIDPGNIDALDVDWEGVTVCLRAGSQIANAIMSLRRLDNELRGDSITRDEDYDMRFDALKAHDIHWQFVPGKGVIDT